MAGKGRGGGGPAKAAKKLENGMKSSHEAKVFENHMSMESFHVNTTSSIVRWLAALRYHGFS